MAALLALLLGVAAQGAATVYYLGPPAQGWTGGYFVNSFSNPIPFEDYGAGDQTLTREALFMHIAQDNPALPSGNEVEIRMLPGEYITKSLQFTATYWTCGLPDPVKLAALTNRVLTIKRAPEANPAEEVIFRMDPDTPGTAGSEIWILGNPYSWPLQRWVIQDLTFDGNWDELSSKAHPAYLASFKTQALALNGYTGLIKNVRARHFGANGLAPIGWPSAAATEAFPISAHATSFRQDPAAGTTHPWIIDGCEVSDFHGYHGGYATAIMVSVGYPADVWEEDPNDNCKLKLVCREDRTTVGGPIPASLQASYNNFTTWSQLATSAGTGKGQRGYRVALVQNCLVRGFPIGLGSAASAGISFTNNVVLQGGYGANFDTGPVYNIDIRNSVFLDLRNGIANVGGQVWGISAFSNFNLMGNLLRLEARGVLQTYYDYYYTNISGATLAVSNTNRVLEQICTNHAEGVTLGGSSGVDFSQNRITTRLRDHFYEPNPADTANAVFTPVSTPTNTTALLWYGTNGWTVNQSPVPPTLTGSKVSSVALDFKTSTSATLQTPAATNPVPAVATAPTGFSAADWFGRVGRVQWLPDSSVVREVSVTAKLVNGDLLVQGRWVEHRTAAGSPEDSTPLGPTPIHFEIRGPNGNYFNPPVTYGATVASTTIWSGELEEGRYTVAAYVESGAPGGHSDWLDRDLDYWAETEHLQGEVVRFVRAADIANDRLGRPGTFTLHRTGTAILVVHVQVLNSSGPGGPSASYPGDYTLRYTDGSSLAQDPNDGTFLVTFAQGVKDMSFQVAPVLDDKAEGELVYLRIDDLYRPYTAASPGPGVTARSVGGFPACPAVAIYDGAPWRFVALTDYDPIPGPYAYATVASGVQDLSNPKIGGYSVYSGAGSSSIRAGFGGASAPAGPLSPVPPTDTTRAGYWTVASYMLMTKLPNAGTTAQVLGISDGSELAGSPPLLVGIDGDYGFYADTFAMLRYTLPLLSGRPAQANGVNPFNPSTPYFPLAPTLTWLVGSAQWSNAKYQAVKWTLVGGAWQVSSLGRFQDGLGDRLGYAYAVNDALRAVGTAEKQVTEGGTVQNRLLAFRSNPGLTFGAGDALKPFGLQDTNTGATYYEFSGVRYYTTNSVARAINVVGDAAGSADTIVSQGGQYQHRARACLWTRGVNLPADLGVLNDPRKAQAGDKSEALGLVTRPYLQADGSWSPDPIGDHAGPASQYVEWVGWGNLTAGSNATRAVWGYSYPYSGWRAAFDLNDTHFVQGLPSWKLEEAHAVGDQDYIVGVGNGGVSAFVLVPLTP